MPGTVTLTAVKGPLEGTRFEFSSHDTFLFGRDAECHARLPESDRTVSRRHFLLEVNPPAARVKDLSSTNGTWVGDVRLGRRGGRPNPGPVVMEADLVDGTTIRAGQHVFDVRITVPAECCECGAVIDAAQKAACAWVADTFICPACRARAVAAARPALPPEPARSPAPVRLPEPARCRDCGAAVPGAPAGAAPPLCPACRVKAERDPAAVLLQMLARIPNRRAPQGSDGPGIPGYEMGALLGRGGMGAVYRARRLGDGATVAVKVMLARVAVDREARKLFQREIEVTRGLRHPNCVQLFEHGSIEGAFYFVMEFCPGGSVDTLMQRLGRVLRPAEAVPIMVQALDGLSFAHEQGIVHRDLKPGNILLTAADGGVAKVSDFGLAKGFLNAGLSGMTATGSVAGTLEFMAREQVTNFRFVKPVVDVWSMGATLYYMLAGRAPRDFQAGQDPLEVVLNVRVTPIRRLIPGLPPLLAEAIDRAVADRTADRFQASSEFRRALAASL